MTRFTLWLVAVAASFGLAAQEKQKVSYYPMEAQIGLSFASYASQEAWGSDRYVDFSPSGMGMAPALKLSVDVLPFTCGNFDCSLLLSGGWRFSNGVDLEAGDADLRSDLSHNSQMSVGALVKMNVTKEIDLGIGLDARQDWMLATGYIGSTDSQDAVWRTWLRLQGRYFFDKGKNVTYFVGAECGFPIASVEVHPANYYRDFGVNTGHWPFGVLDDPSIPSPESFTRGHMPTFEFAIVGGVRFGRHCDR